MVFSRQCHGNVYVVNFKFVVCLKKMLFRPALKICTILNDISNNSNNVSFVRALL